MPFLPANFQLLHVAMSGTDTLGSFPFEALRPLLTGLGGSKMGPVVGNTCGQKLPQNYYFQTGQKELRMLANFQQGVARLQMGRSYQMAPRKTGTNSLILGLHLIYTPGGGGAGRKSGAVASHQLHWFAACEAGTALGSLSTAAVWAI